MSALFAQFLVEARELLESAGAALLRAERDPGDAAAVHDLFRAFHTLKGATGLFDLAPFTRLVHAGEDALMAVRDGRGRMTAELADLLFQAIDQAARWLDGLEETGALPDDAAAAAQALAVRLSGGAGPAGASSAAPGWVERLSEADRRRAGLEGAWSGTALSYRPDPDCFFNGDDPLALCRRIPDLRLLLIEPTGPWPASAEFDPYRCALRFHALSTAPVEAVAAVFRTSPDQIEAAAIALEPLAKPVASTAPEGLAQAMLREQARILSLPGPEAEQDARRAAVVRAVRAILSSLGRAEAVPDGPEALGALIDRIVAPPPAAPVQSARRALRVEPERMDSLMGVVGELAVARAALPPLARQAADETLAQAIRDVAARIDGLVGDLQHAVLRLRMLPLSRVLEPLPRLVRDTARRLGKPVDLLIAGGETEADKDILDALGEPLLHLVRNSLDHGIETPDRRRAAGKPETGTIRVQATQERDGVVVEVADDGAGIDAATIRRSAVAKGIVDAATAEAMSEAEALRLVFAPGFSTSATVSELSGRGVGMDVVRSTVERTGGRVEIASTPGEGTRIRLVLPLTMSITRVLVVETAGELFGIPVTLVGGMARIPGSDIRCVKHAESIVLRDEVVPVWRLRRLLGFAEDGRDRQAEAVLLLDLGGATAGLVVDGFRERADVVLRPMTGVLRGLRGYSGTAVLGDGRLLLVLNPRELL
ncbi:chemotaxis protein CheA [Azospirillum thermophilum]|uniref:Chemotaxis protein CheA n=1 Tax=Azospirillum thermophilum TaxID=2202148 RepID=A0A2S2CXI6_9PROT|nr:chemotaxis protein CheA [Azospirillum thermophilum]AWK89232.1 chemotaxis protein CheA [Azospirillum thermophilum]